MSIIRVGVRDRCRQLYTIVIDNVLWSRTNASHRQRSQSMVAIGAGDQSSVDLMNISVLTPLAEHYNIDLDDLRARGKSIQLIVADYTKRNAVKDTSALMKVLLPLRVGFSGVLLALYYQLQQPSTKTVIFSHETYQVLPMCNNFPGMTAPHQHSSSLETVVIY